MAYVRARARVPLRPRARAHVASLVPGLTNCQFVKVAPCQNDKTARAARAVRQGGQGRGRAAGPCLI